MCVCVGDRSDDNDDDFEIYELSSRSQQIVKSKDRIVLGIFCILGPMGRT
jgi:hypothetical protein